MSRDRGGGYGEAVAKALPDAVQVADRWHLMENVSAAFLDAVRKSMRLVSSLATGVLKDRAAVRAAITQPWSNGQVEAQITKLKLVKRQMYGRAKIDLLEARLLGTA